MSALLRPEKDAFSMKTGRPKHIREEEEIGLHEVVEGDFHNFMDGIRPYSAYNEPKTNAFLRLLVLSDLPNRFTSP
jgi:hypothetical protein